MNSLDALSDRTGRALAAIPFRDREILRLRFGVGDGYVYETSEIGRIWKKDARWARRAVASALKKLAAQDPTLTADSLRTLGEAGCPVPQASAYDPI